MRAFFGEFIVAVTGRRRTRDRRDVAPPGD